MNILIDIGHPGHVHLFKNFIKEMNKRNNKVVVTTKNQPTIICLLNRCNIRYINLGNKKDSLVLKALSQIFFDYKVYNIAKKKKIDLALGTSISITHASKISKFKSLVFNEDNAKEVPFFSKLSYPFADFIITPDCLRFEDHGKKHITYPSYHELAYLHPNNFKPDSSILKDLRVKTNERYFIIRFNLFKAHHDIGVKGISNKKGLINFLKRKGKVFVTTEGNISEEFKKYQIKTPPEKMHSVLYYATMFIGDSQTMTAEAAVLGTPAIRCNSFVGRLSYLEELECKYRLTYGFKPAEEEAMYIKIKELLKNKNIKEEWQKRRQKMLSEKIDFTAFMVWLIENYPESINIIKNNPDYQLNFK